MQALLFVKASTYWLSHHPIPPILFFSEWAFQPEGSLVIINVHVAILTMYPQTGREKCLALHVQTMNFFEMQEFL